MKERLVTCNEEDTDGRARVTRDEERVLPIGSSSPRVELPSVLRQSESHEYKLMSGSPCGQGQTTRILRGQWS